MRLRIVFASPLRLPIHHQHILQSFVYQSMPLAMADFLHDTGYVWGDRSYKMFVFSRLGGSYRLDSLNKTISFAVPFHLFLSSPVEGLMAGMAKKLMEAGQVTLQQQSLAISRVELLPPQTVGAVARVRTLSPIVAYSTISLEEGGSYTMYHEPGEAIFDEVVTNNLRNKYQAFFRGAAPEGEISFTWNTPPKQHIFIHQGGPIKGYGGEFTVSGPAPLLNLGLAAGFGGKNAQGFGMAQAIEGRQGP